MGDDPVAALGVSVEPSFTERWVRAAAPDRLRHEPPRGTRERAGADGWYRLTEADGGTQLAIRLTLHVDLPLPGLSAPAVNRVMRSAMDHTGERFAANLLRHLGVSDRARRA